jgi:hypothetical protein
MAIRLVSRREFFRMTGLGLAGGMASLTAADALARMSGGGMMGGGGSATSVINPPPGAMFRDPPVLGNETDEPGVVQVSLEAAVTPVLVNGVRANLLT